MVIKVYRLKRHADAGFAVNTYDLGVFSTKEKALAEALKREPNKSVREYEYQVTEETVN